MAEVNAQTCIRSLRREICMFMCNIMLIFLNILVTTIVINFPLTVNNWEAKESENPEEYMIMKLRVISHITSCILVFLCAITQVRANLKYTDNKESRCCFILWHVLAFISVLVCIVALGLFLNLEYSPAKLIYHRYIEQYLDAYNIKVLILLDSLILVLIAVSGVSECQNMAQRDETLDHLSSLTDSHLQKDIAYQEPSQLHHGRHHQLNSYQPDEVLTSHQDDVQAPEQQSLESL